MRKILKNKEANAQMIGAVVGILVTIIIAVLVFYQIAANIDASAADADIQNIDSDRTDAANATVAVLDQSATFFTIAPIIAIVVVAVVILGYVSKIGG